ncbi:hypothetical protein C7381_11612 [Ezakiella coagulans]|uniref:Uncharacterized protein n=1 Tax=Ezakiella coagulans TaxID=46507 RepID=A0A2U1DM13_9FIRM|nr:hypothetical protein C7381_11612 [Ezakiella coagulans]
MQASPIVDKEPFYFILNKIKYIKTSKRLEVLGLISV